MTTFKVELKVTVTPDSGPPTTVEATGESTHNLQDAVREAKEAAKAALKDGGFTTQGSGGGGSRRVTGEPQQGSGGGSSR